jgi:5-methylcytosine-specific restriction endonuclease McrA
MVFVLDKNKKPLAPCHPAGARKLLKTGKAKVLKKYPFTIILEREVETEEEYKEKEYRLKIDYGSRHTGLAILKNNKEVVWLAQIEHRTNIKNNLDTRRGHRRFRRNKLRYRKPRFNNRKRKNGWIPPSLQSRVDNIQSWVSKLQKLIPLTHISYENVKFDTQLMVNPEISGAEYQQGTLLGYEVREYLLEKFNRKCIYCGKQNTPLEIEHIVPKSRGGSNKVDNLGIACRDCNVKKGNKTAEEFGYPNIQKQVKKSLRDCAILNATRWAVCKGLKQTGLQLECGTGARTKMNRINLGLSKDHHYDAICIGQSTPNQIMFKTENVLYIKALGRGNYSRTTLDGYGFPRAYLPRQKYFYGFMSGDMVKAVVPKGKHTGVWFGSVACRSTGSFNINLIKGRIQGINHKYCQIIQRFDGYKYILERREMKSSHSSHS